MNLSVHAASLPDILPWRDRHRNEMNCQIVHDSLHARSGWTQPHLLALDGTTVGYGSILVGGPWHGTQTVFEFYLQPEQRSRSIDFFDSFLRVSAATGILAQTNDSRLTFLLHLCAHDIVSEKIIFHDRLTTALRAPDAVFRSATPADTARIFAHRREPIGSHVLEIDGVIAATGGVAFHYNPPYGDIFMEVAGPFQRRGLGAFLVQELKRLCREQGKEPCARCDTHDVASLRTTQKAGFAPCAHLLTGRLRNSPPPA